MNKLSRTSLLHPFKLRYLTSVKQTYKVQGLGKLINKFLWFLGANPNAPIIKAIIQNSANHDYFIDVGSYVGDIIFNVSQYFSKSIGFEPSSSNYHKLMKNATNHNIQNIAFYNCALGDKKGKKRFYLSELNEEDNRFTTAEDPSEEFGGFQSENVTVDILDNILSKHKINQACIIKLDVQGYEPNVLQGASEILKKNCLIISEFWPWGLYVNKTEPYDFVNFIRSLGFEFFHLNNKPLNLRYLKKFCTQGITNKHVWDDFILKKPT